MAGLGAVAWVMKRGGDVYPQANAGLDTPFLQALRELKESPLSTPAQINVGRYFINAIDLHLAGIQSAQEAYRAAVDYIEAGDIPNLGVKERCLATGAEVEYGFKKWLCVPTPVRGRRPGLAP